MSAALRARLARLNTIDVIVCVLLTLLAGVPGLVLAVLLVLVRPGWVLPNTVLALVFPFVADPSAGLLLAAFIALIGFGRDIPEEPRNSVAAVSGRTTRSTFSPEVRKPKNGSAASSARAPVPRSDSTGTHPFPRDDVFEDPDPWNPMSIYITGDPPYLSDDSSPLDSHFGLSSSSETPDSRLHPVDSRLLRMDQGDTDSAIYLSAWSHLRSVPYRPRLTGPSGERKVPRGSTSDKSRQS